MKWAASLAFCIVASCAGVNAAIDVIQEASWPIAGAAAGAAVGGPAGAAGGAAAGDVLGQAVEGKKVGQGQPGENRPAPGQEHSTNPREVSPGQLLLLFLASTWVLWPNWIWVALLAYVLIESPPITRPLTRVLGAPFTLRRRPGRWTPDDRAGLRSRPRRPAARRRP